MPSASALCRLPLQAVLGGSVHPAPAMRPDGTDDRRDNEPAQCVAEQYSRRSPRRRRTRARPRQADAPRGAPGSRRAGSSPSSADFNDLVMNSGAEPEHRPPPRRLETGQPEIPSRREPAGPRPTDPARSEKNRQLQALAALAVPGAQSRPGPGPRRRPPVRGRIGEATGVAGKEPVKEREKASTGRNCRPRQPPGVPGGLRPARANMPTSETGRNAAFEILAVCDPAGHADHPEPVACRFREHPGAWPGRVVATSVGKRPTEPGLGEGAGRRHRERQRCGGHLSERCFPSTPGAARGAGG